MIAHRRHEPAERVAGHGRRGRRFAPADHAARPTSIAHQQVLGPGDRDPGHLHRRLERQRDRDGVDAADDQRRRVLESSLRTRALALRLQHHCALMPAARMIGHHFSSRTFWKARERLRRLLLGRENLLREINELLPDARVGKRVYGGLIEPGDDLLRGALRRPERVPEGEIESRQARPRRWSGFPGAIAIRLVALTAIGLGVAGAALQAWSCGGVERDIDVAGHEILHREAGAPIGHHPGSRADRILEQDTADMARGSNAELPWEALSAFGLIQAISSLRLLAGRVLARRSGTAGSRSGRSARNPAGDRTEAGRSRRLRHWSPIGRSGACSRRASRGRRGRHRWCRRRRRYFRRRRVSRARQRMPSPI